MSDSGLLDMISDLNKTISQLAHRALLKENRLREAESQKLKLELAIRDKDEAMDYILKFTVPKFRTVVEYNEDSTVNLEATKTAWAAHCQKR